MKTPITLRSTLSNTSWSQRGAAALLLVAALIFTLTLALRLNTHAPASVPAVRQAAPAARNPNRPINGTGSAYDGGHGGMLRTPRGATSALPVIGTGSAYDGGAYETARPAVRSSNMLVIGTGSAYDGQSYQSPHPVAVPASPALIGTRSAYDGR